MIGVINCYAYKDLVMSILEEGEDGIKLVPKPAKTREYYLWIVVSSLAYASEYLKKKIGQEYEAIAETIQRLMSERDTSYLSLFKTNYDSTKDQDTL